MLAHTMLSVKQTFCSTQAKFFSAVKVDFYNVIFNSYDMWLFVNILLHFGYRVKKTKNILLEAKNSNFPLQFPEVEVLQRELYQQSALCLHLKAINYSFAKEMNWLGFPAQNNHLAFENWLYTKKQYMKLWLVWLSGDWRPFFTSTFEPGTFLLWGEIVNHSGGWYLYPR